MPTASEPVPQIHYAGPAGEWADILRMRDGEIRRLDAELAAARAENARLRRKVEGYADRSETQT